MLYICLCLTVCIQDLGIHCELCDGGYWQLSLFSPYWMINKTRRELTYRVHIKLTCFIFVDTFFVCILLQQKTTELN